MILVIEGCNGVGKSYQAQKLASLNGLPVIRPFRPSADFHFTGSTTLEQELHALDVPVNTYVDDLYVADILAAFGRSANAVLDRSMPSAIAYNYQARQNRAKLLALWQQMLARAKVVRYVWLVCPYSLAAQRIAARGDHPLSQETYEGLEQSFHESYGVLKLPKTIIDTGVNSAQETTEQLCRLLTS